jgi:hypothetical protein
LRACGERRDRPVIGAALPGPEADVRPWLRVPGTSGANVLDALEVMLTPDDDLPDGDREPLVLTIER